jgi:hypothetical protein
MNHSLPLCLCLALVACSSSEPSGSDSCKRQDTFVTTGDPIDPSRVPGSFTWSFVGGSVDAGAADAGAADGGAASAASAEYKADFGGDSVITLKDPASGLNLSLDWPVCGQGRIPAGKYMFTTSDATPPYSSWVSGGASGALVEGAIAAGDLVITTSTAGAILGTFDVTIARSHLQGTFYASCTDTTSDFCK